MIPEAEHRFRKITKSVQLPPEWVFGLNRKWCSASFGMGVRDQPEYAPLTFAKCLPIIAPNTIVRDELRGLLGWMAALGNKPIEEAAIELDPYAVLANGDPSQLEDSSKRLLVKRLKEIEAKDPHFRRGDLWRRFSVAGFFTQDVVEEIKPVLSTGSEGHLRDLILEILKGSSAIGEFRDELHQLTFSPEVSRSDRLLASSCLHEIAGYDPRDDLESLVSEASLISLEVAAKIIETIEPETLDRAYLLKLFQACADLYPGHKVYHEHTIGERYFVKRLIKGLDKATIVWLLDELSKDLACKCGKEPYECDCRNGMSKIIGSLLDRYFEVVTPPFEPIQIWEWVKNLNFHESKSAGESKAVQVLQEDDGLRQGIIAYVFGKLTDRKQIIETKIHKFGGHSHSGISFHTDDYKYIVDLAFETNNPNLWVSFITNHRFTRNKEYQGPDSLRRHMRQQASIKPLFMYEWAKSNRAAARYEREHRVPSYKGARRMKRHRRQQDNIREANIRYVQANRELVESGRHWGCLIRFAELLLLKPDRIEQEFGEKLLVHNALNNCLDFIASEVPDLSKLAELRCFSKSLNSEIVLYAVCLEKLRNNGNLEGIDLRLLKALRTKIDVSYSAVSEEERDALKTEVDRQIFHDLGSAEDYIRKYIEPQLELPGCPHPDIWLLHSDDVFSHLRATLSIEWLGRFPGLALSPLDTLFNIAAQYGNRNSLNEIISKCCAEFMSNWPSPTGNIDIEKKRTFWFVRAWYFLKNTPEIYWNWIKEDKDTVFVLYELSGWMSRSDHPYWPRLTSGMVEAILDAYIDKWRKRPKIDICSFRARLTHTVSCHIQQEIPNAQQNKHTSLE